MNPGVIFQDIAQKAHSVILTSGTLTPVSIPLMISMNSLYYNQVHTFEAELGIQL
jgi:Rad3-related DNA helicase